MERTVLTNHAPLPAPVHLVADNPSDVMLVRREAEKARLVNPLVAIEVGAVGYALQPMTTATLLEVVARAGLVWRIEPPPARA